MKREPYPEMPNDWNDGKQIACRNFYFNYVDLQVLKHLVRDHLSDKGNEGITKARLKYVLGDYEHRLIVKNNYIKKYGIFGYVAYGYGFVRQYFARKFKTKYYRLAVLSNDIVMEVLAEEKLDKAKKAATI